MVISSVGEKTGRNEFASFIREVLYVREHRAPEIYRENNGGPPISASVLHDHRRGNSSPYFSRGRITNFETSNFFDEDPMTYLLILKKPLKVGAASGKRRKEHGNRRNRATVYTPRGFLGRLHKGSHFDDLETLLPMNTLNVGLEW